MVHPGATIHVAADHAGFMHKDAVSDWLKSEGFTVEDHGAYQYDEADDFPDFIVRAALAVARTPLERAIIFGGSGQGEAMLANRLPGVRATVLYSDSPEIVALSRAHNNANVLSIGARFLSVDDAKRHVWEWLHGAALADEKYERRNAKIDALAKNLHL
jgi:ribose 5-phosphate isomerase B